MIRGTIVDKVHKKYQPLFNQVAGIIRELGRLDDPEHVRSFVNLLGSCTVQALDKLGCIDAPEPLDDHEALDALRNTPTDGSEFIEPVGPELRDDYGNVLRCRVVPVPDEGDAALRKKEQVDLIRHLGPGVVRCPEKIQ